MKFNPLADDFQTNPYPIYDHLRSSQPICHSVIGGDWVLTRYEDVKSILKDRRVVTVNKGKLIEEKAKYLKNRGQNIQALADTTNKFLFYLNPPDHNRLRSLVGQVFSPVKIKEMRPKIETIFNECLDKALSKGEIDIIEDIAQPIPVRMIGMILGIPPNDIKKSFNHWTRTLSRIIDPLIPLAEYETLNQVALEAQQYFHELIFQREKDPQQDLISHLITARDESGKLNEQEVLSMCIMLFVTAQDTTVNTIGNGMLALLQHPDQMDKLKQEPEIIDTAVEEILRFDSPVQMATRIANESLKIGGQTIQKGENIHLCLGSANRDPAEFSNPDQFDVLRQKNNHLAFGDGIHLCLGAPLARLEAKIIINSLLQKLPNLKLASNKLEWRKTVATRGLNELLVTVIT
ncbi:MAG: cytochrome P450 [Symploca sp. SIO1C2]|nr:cytochrome P450 [Symploca sp. SIO1C2]